MSRSVALPAPSGKAAGGPPPSAIASEKKGGNWRCRLPRPGEAGTHPGETASPRPTRRPFGRHHPAPGREMPLKSQMRWPLIGPLGFSLPRTTAPPCEWTDARRGRGAGLIDRRPSYVKRAGEFQRGSSIDRVPRSGGFISIDEAHREQPPAPARRAEPALGHVEPMTEAAAERLGIAHVSERTGRPRIGRGQLVTVLGRLVPRGSQACPLMAVIAMRRWGSKS